MEDKTKRMVIFLDQWLNKSLNQNKNCKILEDLLSRAKVQSKLEVKDTLLDFNRTRVTSKRILELAAKFRVNLPLRKKEKN